MSKRIAASLAYGFPEGAKIGSYVYIKPMKIIGQIIASVVLEEGVFPIIPVVEFEYVSPKTGVMRKARSKCAWDALTVLSPEELVMRALLYE